MLTEDSAINVPAVAAAHVIKRYTAQASDEISFEVRLVALYQCFSTCQLFSYLCFSEKLPRALGGVATNLYQQAL